MTRIYYQPKKKKMHPDIRTCPGKKTTVESFLVILSGGGREMG
jgi:hypothetical protein